MDGDRLGLTDLLEIRDVLLRTEAMRFRVAGWSMYPTLWPGDQLTAELVSPAQLQVGDLVLIHQRGRVICHRLIAVQAAESEPRLVTRGDGQSGSGDMIRPDHALGRVVAVRRRWPWVRGIRWACALAMRLDRGRERLIDFIAGKLQILQGVPGYRWIMRNTLLRSIEFYLGVSEGERWFRYERISGRKSPDTPAGQRGFHLVAKFAGVWVGSVRVTPSGGGHRIDDLYVRIRCRGMGVGSKLLALAANAASEGGRTLLLAWVEPANTIALDLVTKAGFRQTAGNDGHSICLRRDVRDSADGP